MHTAEIEHLQSREAEILTRLEKLNGPADQHLEGVAKHFHLGMVGGSGRNTHRLNQRRERAMDKSISNAVEATKLYNELGTIQAKIKDLQAGGPEKRAQKEADRDKLRAEYWRQLKAGGTIDIGNGPSTIVEKNKKSLITQSGCTWTAADIIGRTAAALL